MQAKSIRPEKNKKRVTCTCCNLSYTAREYSILFDNKKLVYFRLKTPEKRRTSVLCHSCLFETVAKRCGDKKHIKLKITDGDTQYSCKIYPKK